MYDIGTKVLCSKLTSMGKNYLIMLVKDSSSSRLFSHSASQPDQQPPEISFPRKVKNKLKQTTRRKKNPAPMVCGMSEA